MSDGRRTLRAAPEAQWQVVQAADDERLHVGQRARVHELNVVEPREEPLEADARLGAGQARTGTEVLTVTEGDVAPSVRTPRIEAVEFADSLTLRVRFDRAVAADWDATGAATLVSADSTARATGPLLSRERFDSLRAAEKVAAPVDSTVADTTAVADTVAADTVAADTVAAPSAPRFARPLPIQIWVLPLDATLAPGAYRLTIRNVRGLNGRSGNTEREFTVRAPAPAADTSATRRP